SERAVFCRTWGCDASGWQQRTTHCHHSGIRAGPPTRGEPVELCSLGQTLIRILERPPVAACAAQAAPAPADAALHVRPPMGILALSALGVVFGDLGTSPL